MQTVLNGVKKKQDTAMHLKWRDKMKKGIKIGIVAKLVIMSVLPVIMLGIILTVSGQDNLKKGIKNEIYEGLKTTALAVEGAYDAAGNGDFTMLESGNIIKGMFVVSGNYNLADKLSERSGTEVSLYYGNKIIVTSLKDDSNERLEDETVSAEIEETVLKQGKEYFSENVTLGEKATMVTICLS